MDDSRPDQELVMVSSPILEIVPPIGDPDPEDKPKRKIKRGEVHEIIVGAMTNEKFRTWPKFPAKLHRWVDHRGESLIYEQDEHGIVREVSESRVDALIANYWKQLRRIGTLAASDAVRTRQLWLVSAPGRPEPFPLLTWASDSRPAHHKMAFDPLPMGECQTPLFDELMKRTTNFQALRTWIGSIFDENSQLQQYVWLHGHGGNGKGALVRALTRELGSAAKADTAPDTSRLSQFWTHGLMGKRLCVFPDCDRPEFVKSGLFKSLTGEDDVRVEPKGKSVLSIRFSLKLLFTSNDKPAISGSKADLRRVIYCSIADVTDRGCRDYEAALQAEAPAFISKCWASYSLMSKGDSRYEIVSKNEAEVAEVVANEEHDFEAFVEDCLIFDRDENGRIVENKAFITRAIDMTEAMDSAGIKSKREKDGLRKYLERKHGITYKVTRRLATEKSANGKGYEDVKLVYQPKWRKTDRVTDEDE